MSCCTLSNKNLIHTIYRLRSKPVAVFSKKRYGQEELLNLWTFSPSCPQTILDIGDLNPVEALRPACLTNDVEESQVSF